MTATTDTRVHELKIWPAYFEPVVNGDKTFELRRNDRNFREGDALILREFDPNESAYTGRHVKVRVTYLLHAAPEFGLLRGFIIMGIRVESVGAR